MKTGIRLSFSMFFLLTAFPLLSQQEGVLYIGMSLEDVLSRFGTPTAVYAARGEEHWQDDVVFEYPQGDFYIYRDRVWQASLRSAHGIAVGDPKPAVLLTLGSNAADHGNYVLYQLPSSPGTAWPLALRVNFSNIGIVSAIFMYRSDF
ncbi:MAG: hypothetical protein FWG99_07785 [Treponema sp.]|nr:hypothetical protein [Treponema sp.]